MKYYILIAMIFCGFLSAQSNPEVKKLRDISEKYFYLLKDYSKKYKKQRKESFFLKKIDSLHEEYRREEALQLKKIKDFEENSYAIPGYEANPCYRKSDSFSQSRTPDFDKYLKDYRSKRSYYDVKNIGDKSLKTFVSYIVEINGQVSFVRAEGVNGGFNREVEAMIYKVKFYKPQCVNGLPERTRFKMPITMVLD